jgi:hypothetical protein
VLDSLICRIELSPEQASRTAGFFVCNTAEQSGGASPVVASPWRTVGPGRRRPELQYAKLHLTSPQASSSRAASVLRPCRRSESPGASQQHHHENHNIVVYIPTVVTSRTAIHHHFLVNTYVLGYFVLNFLFSLRVCIYATSVSPSCRTEGAP